VDIWLTLVLMVHVLAALGVIGLVLLQHGKGADVGAAFGSGASGSLFGATGSANFLSRTTAILAAVFFVSSLGLAYLANVKPRAGGSVMDAGPPPAAGATKADPNKPPADPAQAPAVPSAPASKPGEVPK
jgi:preprotein translocase subunit SecG